MKKSQVKQLLKMALLTAPLMAIIYATPLYIFKAIPLANSYIVFPLVAVPIFIAWLLNILLLAFVKSNWVHTLWRTLLVCFIMFGVSGLVIHFLKPLIAVSESGILLVRVVNILSVNAIIYILIDLLFTKENKNKIELENSNLKLVKLEADYKLLKDQVNPHFLFNALSTAKALIKNNPALAEEYIVRLSDFLRLSINNTKKTVTLKEELQLCIDFIVLNKIRFGDTIVLEQTIEEKYLQDVLPYFSLLSLVENAIKHNRFSAEAPLLIKLSVEDNWLVLRNTRQEKFTMERASGTGLRNLNERYKLLSGKEIEITSNNTYFQVRIPLLKN